jgi:sugar lactone lactonase YvrE
MKLLLIAALLITTAVSAQTPEIIAGTGKSGFSGDGLPATVAKLRVPSDLFVTPDGSVYIADTGNNRIRRVNPDGKIETIAGNGQRVFTTDGVKATEAGLMSPSSVAVDGAGNIYVAEWTGHRIRKIDKNGILSTVAGNGESGYEGENLPATETSLNAPSRIFLDGKGNLFVAEFGSNRVRVVKPNGRISTVAGTGEKGFGGDGGKATGALLDRPNGLFVTDTGEIYITDLGNNRVRHIDAAGIIHTIAGDGKSKYLGDEGPATEASLNTPAGLFVDSVGNIFVCDGRNKKVRRIDANGTINTWVHGIITKDADGKPNRQPLRSPSSTFVDKHGHIYVADGSINAIIRMPSDAAPTTLTVSTPGAVGYAREVGFWQKLMDLF